MLEPLDRFQKDSTLFQFTDKQFREMPSSQAIPRVECPSPGSHRCPRGALAARPPRMEAQSSPELVLA